MTLQTIVDSPRIFIGRDTQNRWLYVDLRGTYDAGDTASLSVTLVGRTYTSASGAVALFPAEARWQLALPLVDSLREGTFSVTVVARDQAGNTATDPSSGELVVGVGTPVTRPIPCRNPSPPRHSRSS